MPPRNNPKNRATTTVFSPQLIWNDDMPAPENRNLLGQALASSSSDRYRPAGRSSLLHMTCDGQDEITNGADLLLLVVDRIPFVVIKPERRTGSLIPMTHLNAALKTEAFLHNFRVVDHVSGTPFFLAKF